MDTSETYIKMCEKATEIQNDWRNSCSNKKWDYVFISTFQYYKRSIIKKATSHYRLCDTKEENPAWVRMHNGIRGVELIVHWVGKENHQAIDSSYPDSKVLVQVEQVRNRLFDEDYIPIEWCVWLPRQDQLQEMIREKVAWVLAKAFAATVYHLSGDTGMSIKQLWLAFVMQEKYNKVWNGEDWVASPQHTGTPLIR